MPPYFNHKTIKAYATVKFVEEEIEKYKLREIDTLHSNVKLSGLLGIPAKTICRYMGLLSKDTRRLRKEGFQSGLGKLPKEQRIKLARGYGYHAYPLGLGRISREERSAIAKHNFHRHLGKFEKEELSKFGKKGYRSGLGKLSHKDKVNFGKKAFRVSRTKPNKLESKVIKALKKYNLFAENSKTAQFGQIYYPGSQENKWFRKLLDGKYKLPDFKVKGHSKVIEIYSSYYHSKEFCQKIGKADYNWDSDKMIEEYHKIGLECKIFWDYELATTENVDKAVCNIASWVSPLTK